MSATEGQKLTDVLDDFVENTSGETISVGDLLGAVESRSFGPMLLAPALVAASPIGAIPGMSLVTGTLIVLLAGQLLAGRPRPWLPKAS